jgi:predicted Zn-dependent protease with MMP-like domain
LTDLPEPFASRLDNVTFRVTRAPSLEERRRLRLEGSTLYGLYEGIALLHRGSGYDRVTPDRITIFWGPLVRDFRGDGELQDQVRKTVYHELGHYFGLEEGDLDSTSVR